MQWQIDHDFYNELMATGMNVALKTQKEYH